MSAGRARSWRGVIAIDGPAASGKSTLARLLATELGLAYLDTGAFYRAAALAVLRAGKSWDNEEAAVEVVSRVEITQQEGRTRLDKEDVDEEIRTPGVTAAASQVAALGGVRRILVDRQQKWVAERGNEAVVEGRDIGSVVFPNAPVKVFLTADHRERTLRRSRETTGSGPAEGAAGMALRDRQDTRRQASPLRKTPDAIVIDTTSLDPHQVVAEVLKRIDGLAAGPEVGE